MWHVAFQEGFLWKAFFWVFFGGCLVSCHSMVTASSSGGLRAALRVYHPKTSSGHSRGCGGGVGGVRPNMVCPGHGTKTHQRSVPMAHQGSSDDLLTHCERDLSLGSPFSSAGGGNVNP